MRGHGNGCSRDQDDALIAVRMPYGTAFVCPECQGVIETVFGSTDERSYSEGED